MKLAFIGLWCLAALVIVAAAFNIVPPTASLLISVAALLLSASVSYLTSFRGPDIRLLLAPAHAFDNSMVSGYSAGMPSTWNITVNLLAVNDGPRPGMLVRFEVDADSVEYCPRKPTAFTVTFSGLEWKKAPHPSAVSSSFTLPLPLPLQALAREPASFRAMLTFSTADSGILADDLREIRGLRVKYRFGLSA